MAITEKQVQDLLKGMNDLLTQMKQKNAAAANEGFRVGRTGSANAKSASRASNSVEVLADSLMDLHKSMKSGGRSLSDYFEEMLEAIRPLNAAFKKLDKSVEDINVRQGKIAGEAAKVASEYTKAQEGNVEAIKKLSKELDEYYEVVKDLVTLQSDTKRDQAKINELLEKELELREKFNDEDLFDGNIIGTKIQQYFKKLTDDPNAKLRGRLAKEVNGEMAELSTRMLATNTVFKDFLYNVKTSMAKFQTDMDKAVKGLATTVTTSMGREIAKLPSLFSARLQSGVMSYNMGEAAFLGMSPAQLAEYQSSNRSAINAITGFGTRGDLVGDGRLESWAAQGRMAGLNKEDAANWVAGNMNAAFRQGRTLDTTSNAAMLKNQQFMQQGFNFRNIQEASAAWNDFTDQMYNLEKYNRVAQIKDEKQRAKATASIEEEMKMRLAVGNAMGLELDQIKQRQQTMYNDQFKDLRTRIRAGYLAQAANKQYQDQFGWSDEKTAARAMRDGGFGNQLSAAQNKLVEEADRQVGEDYQKMIQGAGKAYAKGDIGSAMSQQARYIVPEFFRSGTFAPTFQEMYEDSVKGGNRQRAQGNMTGNQVYDALNANVSNLEASTETLTGKFEKLAMVIDQLVSGFGQAPGVSTGAALISGGVDIAQTAMYGRIGLKGLDKVLGATRKAKGVGKGVGSTMLGRMGKGLGGRLTSSVGKGGIGGLIGGLTLGLAADAVGTDTSAGAGLDVGATALSGAGLGAMFGGPIGAALGAVVGMEKGIWDNLDTLSPALNEDDTALRRRLRILSAPALAMSMYSGMAPKAPASVTANLGSTLDAANGIVRDANGQPIAHGAGDNDLKKLVELTQQQVDIAKTDQKDTKLYRDQMAAVASHKQSVQEYTENLASTMVGMFTAPA